MNRIALAALSLALLQNCASIVEGTHQDITLNTTPPAANCALDREGASIATIPATPATVEVRRTREDITVRCRKAGQMDATYLTQSGMEEWFWGNLALGGLLGMGIDWATGAYNEYDDIINLTLPTATAAEAAPALPVPAAATAPTLSLAPELAPPSGAPARAASPFGTPSTPLKAGTAAAAPANPAASANASRGWGELGTEPQGGWGR